MVCLSSLKPDFVLQSSVSDIDFEEKHISVDHQLQRTRDMQYIIEDTKTTSGTGTIPMTEEVYECFKRIVENRKKPKKEPAIDGYKGFLFLSTMMMEKAIPFIRRRMIFGNVCRSLNWHDWRAFLAGKHYILSTMIK